MKLTVQTRPFLQMLRMLQEQQPEARSGTGDLVSLAACGERLCVRVGVAKAETEAMVWEEGQCHVSARKILDAVRTSCRSRTLSIETRGGELRAGESSIPLKRRHLRARLPGAVQIFLKSDFGVVSQKPEPAAAESGN